MLETALAGLRAAGDERGQITARLLLAVQAGKRGEIQEGIRSADAALADARRIGDRWMEGYALSQRQTLLNWADDVDAVNASIEPTLTALRDSGNRQVLMTTLGILAIVAIERLDLDQAEAYLAEAEGLARRVGSQLASASIDRSRGYLERRPGATSTWPASATPRHWRRPAAPASRWRKAATWPTSPRSSSPPTGRTKRKRAPEKRSRR